MIAEICKHEECTGCGACAGVCPKSCIILEGDEFGYIHPVIDQNACINCGMCVKVCPNNRDLDFWQPFSAYASWNLNSQQRESSASGGIAAVLSNAFIRNGGIVYGAVAQTKGGVSHQRADNANDCNKFKGSKYVQSSLPRSIYNALHDDLKENRKVLFFGTPCQTAAIRSFSKDHPNLYCVDIICHGVPSQKILRDHINMVTNGRLKDIVSFSTRDNRGFYFKLSTNSDIIYDESFPKDAYENAFQYALFYRPSCYQCHYSKPQRQSDITIGDFWGLGKTEYPKEKVSVVLPITEKGSQLLDSIRDAVFLEERSVVEAVKGNHNLQRPSSKHEFYNLFRYLYPRFGYKTAVNLSLLKFRIKQSIFKLLVKNKAFRNYYYK